MGTRPKAMHTPNTRLIGHQEPNYKSNTHLQSDHCQLAMLRDVQASTKLGEDQRWEALDEEVRVL
jgi:hypothetical protein